MNTKNTKINKISNGPNGANTKESRQKKARIYLTAISIEAGIITLIGETGAIENYRQRGIGSLPQNVRTLLIGKQLLHPRWEQVKELPRHYSIVFEDEEIMGKARATYPDAAKLLNGIKR